MKLRHLIYPVFGTFVASVVLIVALVLFAAAKQDDTHLLSEKTVVRLLLESHREHLELFVEDNAVWTEPVSNIVAAQGSQWMEEAFGDLIYHGSEVEAVMVFDAADQAIFLRKNETFPEYERIFPAGLAEILKAVPNGSADEHAGMSGYLVVDDMIVIFGASQILPNVPEGSSAAALPGKKATLVLLSTLDEEELHHMGEEGAIPGLKVSTKGDGLLAIDDIAGNPVGALTWDRAMPGKGMLASMVWPAAFFIAVLCFVSFRFYQNVSSLFNRTEQSERAKSEFLANMSHEIRTPLNGILGMAQIISKSRLDERQKRFVATIVESCQSLQTVIADILDFSRIEAGKLVLATKPTNLPEFIEDACTVLAVRTDNETDIELTLAVGPDFPRSVDIDPDRFRQILTNFVSNAYKFTDAGNIEVCLDHEVRDDKAIIVLSVTDTGRGIPHHKLEQVFEKFEQVDGSQTREKEGTGLGLAICSRLAHLMGGRVGVESQVGRGSCFWFRFEAPILDKAGRDDHIPRELLDINGLLVEPNEILRQNILDQMHALGVPCLATGSPRDAIDIMKEQAALGRPVQLFIVDVSVMDRESERLLARARAYAKLGMRFLVMQSPSRADKQWAWGEDENVDTILKPICPGQFVGDLRTALEKIGPPEDPCFLEEGRPERKAGKEEQAFAFQEAAPLVLVAEDNAINRDVAVEMLSMLGFRHAVARNGLEAIRKYKSLTPDVILMDISMPILSGYDATRIVRNLPANGNEQPFIVGMTAHALAGDREKCLEAGMDAYIAKPATYAELEGVLSGFLERTGTIPAPGQERQGR